MAKCHICEDSGAAVGCDDGNAAIAMVFVMATSLCGWLFYGIYRMAADKGFFG